MHTKTQNSLIVDKYLYALLDRLMVVLCRFGHVEDLVLELDCRLRRRPAAGRRKEITKFKSRILGEKARYKQGI